jgi:hypothetical protein
MMRSTPLEESLMNPWIESRVAASPKFTATASSSAPNSETAWRDY